MTRAFLLKVKANSDTKCTPRGQMDLFTDYEQKDAESEATQEALEKERRLQQAVLVIKDKFGSNAVLKGTNFLEGARGRERHGEVGGHKA